MLEDKWVDEEDGRLSDDISELKDGVRELEESVRDEGEGEREASDAVGLALRCTMLGCLGTRFVSLATCLRVRLSSRLSGTSVMRREVEPGDWNG